MRQSHPIEALLRPPVEILSGTVAILCGVMSALGPQYFMVTPSVGYGAGACLVLFGIWWLSKGVSIVRYQKNLRRLPKFLVTPKALPLSRRWLYLGRGFRWGERHTQRLHDTRRSKFRSFVQAPAFIRWLREAERQSPDFWAFRFTQWDHWLNPVRPPPPVGGSPHLHGVELKESDIHMPLPDRNGHTLVLGTTRVGKTRALEIMVSQDIRRGETVIVIDPKGDADLLRSVFNACKLAGREDDFQLFHLGYPEISARYNGVGQFNRITEVSTRVSSQLSGEGQSAVFREFVWRFTNIVAKAVVALGQRPDYRTILKHVTNIDGLFVSYAESYFSNHPEVIEQVEALEQTINPERQPRFLQGRPKRLIAYEQVISDTGMTDDVLEGLRSAFKYEKSYFDKIVASLLPLLEKLTTGLAADLLSPDYLDLADTRPIFSWRQIVNQTGVVYVGLDALTDSAVASAVGNSMFADLVSYAGERYKHGDGHGLRAGDDLPQSPIVVHLDEFSELMGDEFIPMLNKGGAAGLQITAYSQTYADIHAGIGSQAKAKQVAGNFNNLIMFRVKDIETAAILTDQLPEVSVHDITLIAGYNDSSDPNTDIDFTSRHEDRITASRVKMLEAHDIVRLPKGQAFALLEGGTLYKLRLPMAKVSRRRSFHGSFEDITRDMHQRYRTSSHWWLGSGEATVAQDEAV